MKLNFFNFLTGIFLSISTFLIVGTLFEVPLIGPIAALAIFIIFSILIPWWTGKDYGINGLIISMCFAFIGFMLVSGAKYPEVPEFMKGEELPEQVKPILQNFFGLPEEWLYMPAIFYLFVIPFLAIFAMVEGIINPLTEIWHNWAHVLAFCIAFATIPAGIFGRIVAAMLATLGLYSIAIFVLFFFLSGISLVIGNLGGIRSATSEAYKELISEIEAQKEYDELLTKAKGVIDALRLSGELDTAKDLAKNISEAHKKFYGEKKYNEACEILRKSVKEAQEKVRERIEKRKYQGFFGKK